MIHLMRLVKLTNQRHSAFTSNNWLYDQNMRPSQSVLQFSSLKKKKDFCKTIWSISAEL